jgi:hypothetical protein
MHGRKIFIENQERGSEPQVDEAGCRRSDALLDAPFIWEVLVKYWCRRRINGLCDTDG